MSTLSRPAAPTYIAEVRNSTEVTLHGTADLKFWSEKLQPEGLVPADRDGRAQVMISAVNSRWLGVRFSELIVAVVTQTLSGESDWPSLYLVAAFNTSRSFTFIEQRYFQTPYSYATIEVASRAQSTLALKQGKVELLQAVCTRDVSGLATVPELWEGVIYLPPRTRAGKNTFYARLGGETAVIPYERDLDQLTIHPSPSNPVCGWLLQSDFTGQEWHIRRAATHARSKTFPRRQGRGA